MAAILFCKLLRVRVGQRLRRIAARLRTTAIKNVNANSVLHMPTSPHCRRHNGFLCDFFWFKHPRRRRHTSGNLRLIVTILVIAAAPAYAQVQNSTPAKVTKADAQKVLTIISSDKVKTRIYCQMAKLGNQIEQANEMGDAKKFDALFQRMYELGKKLGPEYAALIDGLQDINPESEVGQEISSTLDALDNLCRG
jgi:hypothetical protein